MSVGINQTRDQQPVVSADKLGIGGDRKPRMVDRDDAAILDQDVPR
jgi:hypothetical protein